MHHAGESNAHCAYLSGGLGKGEKKDAGKSLRPMHCRGCSSTARRKYRIIGVLVRGIMHEGAHGHAINVRLRRDPRKILALPFRRACIGITSNRTSRLRLGRSRGGPCC